MKLWHLFFNREVTPSEAFQPTDECRECGAATSEVRLETLDDWDAALATSCAALAEVPAPPRESARVFLMPLKFDRLTEAVAHLSVRGWRMKFRAKYVEMLRP